MDDTFTPPALPPHAGSEMAMARAQERVAEPVVAVGMVTLMALMWLAGWLVLSPIWAGTPFGASLRDATQARFSPLPVATRLPQILIAEPAEAQAANDTAMSAWEDTRQQAEYVAGALVEDEVQGVLLKLHLIAETGKFVGRMVSEK